MRKMLIAVMCAVAVAIGLTAVAIAGNGPPKKVWICHFADSHTAASSWSGGGTTLDGDYVLNWVDGGPTEVQIAYCLEHGGLGVLEVAATAAENGHGAQLLERIAGYPEG